MYVAISNSGFVFYDVLEQSDFVTRLQNRLLICFGRIQYAKVFRLAL
jgi:hypothetical protein